MAIQVFTGAPECSNPPCWGGACGQYYGFDVRVYDTSRPRPNGSDDPWSKNYRFYPAEGATVIAKFYEVGGSWSKTVVKRIPTNQPKGEDIAWVNMGTEMPCDICDGKDHYIVGCDLKVTYKGFTWTKSFPKLLKITCPPPPGQSNPEFIRVASTDLVLQGNTVCTEMWLTACELDSFDIPVALYMSGTGEKYHAISVGTARLHKDRKIRVCFDIPEKTHIPEIDLSARRYVAIAVNKDVVVGKDWACAKEWLWGI